ncbi:MAG: sulfurtransferase [Thermoanaerobaculia bacterium]|nr:MAG: sulfurtransferase [Thermoanaerobaculia bacterium]
MPEPFASRGYARPEVLVSTEWLAEHLGDSGVRVVESNEDPLVYPSGHVPGAVEIDWLRDLNDPLRRDTLDGERFAELMSRHGIAPATTVVLYGDQNNWWACYAFWILQLFGHTHARILDGGRLKWLREERPVTRAVPSWPAAAYPVPRRHDAAIRAFRAQVFEQIEEGRPLVDVRSPEEYRGERLHMPGYPNEGALRGGHIPGARNVPWARAVDAGTGEFLPAAALEQIYLEEQGLRREDGVVAYCRIGERSSHTWFVLTYLLGFRNVRNYDGSWTEWGNLVGAPIER